MFATYALGIDVGGSKISAGLIDAKGRVLRDISLPTPLDKGPFGIVDALVHAGKEVTQSITKNELAGVGIGVPGQVDFMRQEIEFSTNLPLAGVDICSLAESAFRVPVTVDNDGHLATLGECRYGAGKKVSDFLMLTIGTGVGGGICLGGELYRGARGLSSEFGHVVIDTNGPACPCGGRGHLESYLGAPALAALAQEAAKKPNGKAIYDAAGRVMRNVSAQSLIIAAAGGDKVACSILEERGAILGQALVGFVNIFNPSVICIGGGIGEAANALVESAARVVHTHALAGRKDVEIIQATLGNDAGILGAAALAFDEYETREGFCL